MDNCKLLSGLMFKQKHRQGDTQPYHLLKKLLDESLKLSFSINNGIFVHLIICGGTEDSNSSCLKTCFISVFQLSNFKSSDFNVSTKRSNLVE